MRIGVVHYYSKPTWSVQQLIKAAEEKGHTPVYLRVQGIDAELGGERISLTYMGREIGAEALVVRSFGSTPSVEQLLKRVGVLEAFRASVGPAINKPLSMLWARDKWFSLLRLFLKGLPIPWTMVTENPYSAIRFTERYGRIVFKPIIGSLGLGSTLVENADTAYLLSRTLLAYKQPSYMQVYIEKPGYDIRAFVVGDHVIGAMKRVVREGWKTNIARGARGAPLREKDDPEAYELAVKAAEALDLDYTGVDIVVDHEGRHYIIEANASPLWRGLMEATGVNPAEHIIEYIENIARR